MGHVLTGDQLQRALRKLGEIQRQFGHRSGYPFNPQQALGALQAVVDGRFEWLLCETFTRTLDLITGSCIIDHLVEKGSYAFVNPLINGENYPVECTGIVRVRYGLLCGASLERPDGYVYRVDVEADFRTRGMRCPRPEEALAVPADDYKIGCSGHPLVMFIDGSNDAFGVDMGSGARSLILAGSGRRNPYCDFLGVYE